MRKILFVLLLGFMSCDKYTNYSLYIDNQSDDTIEIVLSEGSPYSMIDPAYLTFPPKTKKLFYGAEGREGKDGCDYTGIEEGEISISPSSGRELVKEIWVVSNWNCSGSNDKGWTQTFVITENDLE